MGKGPAVLTCPCGASWDRAVIPNAVWLRRAHLRRCPVWKSRKMGSASPTAPDAPPGASTVVGNPDAAAPEVVAPTPSPPPPPPEPFTPELKESKEAEALPELPPFLGKPPLEVPDLKAMWSLIGSRWNDMISRPPGDPKEALRWSEQDTESLSAATGALLEKYGVGGVLKYLPELMFATAVLGVFLPKIIAIRRLRASRPPGVPGGVSGEDIIQQEFEKYWRARGG